jgi:hypothetical protein
MASFLMLCYALDAKRTRPYCPPLPATPVTVVAGDVVTYRSMGDVHTGIVLAVGEFFDEPAYLIGKLWISGGQVVGIVESRVAA